MRRSDSLDHGLLRAPLVGRALLVTTTRKFFSILISSFVLGSTLVGQQWAGIGLLFAGLLWNMQIKSSKGGSKRAKKAK